MDMLSQKLKTEIETPWGIFTFRRLTVRQQAEVAGALHEAARSLGFGGLQEFEQNAPAEALSLRAALTLNAAQVDRPQNLDWRDVEDQELLLRVLEQYGKFLDQFRTEVPETGGQVGGV